MALPNTHYGAEYLASFLQEPKHIFFAGIGGISMCSLAWIAHIRGHHVSGYDRTPTQITKRLTEDGIPVFYREDASHIEGIDLLVYTVAIPQDNTEYATALSRGILCVSRADFLGYIMTSYKTRIGVCGMHGKSTTTSMLERIFSEAGRDPVVSCGATMKDVGAPYRIGRGSDFIFEACEYMDSFLDFYPTTAVVLNIEMDHVDYFKSMRQICDSFGKFMAKTEPDGYAVINTDNEEVRQAAASYTGHLVTFSRKNPNADFFAGNVKIENACPSFDLYFKGSRVSRISLSIPGQYNITDALAASAAAFINGVPAEAIARGLNLFSGAERRLELCGRTADGAAVYSDYSHHPTEISAVLSTVREMGYAHVYCVFQPHTYSRTQELMEGFASALSSIRMDQLVLADIYPARETNLWGVSSEQLAEKIRAKGQPCEAIPDFNTIINYVLGHTFQGDMILIMGAGDINSIVKNLLG